MIEEAAIDTRQFRFSAILDEAYQDILPILLALEDRLNEEIQLADYTDAIDTIYFTPMILEDQTGYEERLEYNGESKEVFIQIFVEHANIDFLGSLQQPLLSIFKEKEEAIQITFIIDSLESGKDSGKPSQSTP